MDPVDVPDDGGARLPRRRRRRRVVTTATAVLAVVVGLPLLVYQVSVQPGAALARSVFERGASVVAGPTVPIERDTVAVHRGIGVPVDGAPDARLDVYAPADAAPGDDLPVILWIHGGGFISGSAADLAGYTTVLADEGYVVASLEYSLAPEVRYPAPVLQARAALAVLREEAATYGGDASRVVVGGDSAGAQIASQVAVVETSPSLAEEMGVSPALRPGELRGAILFCGLYDMDTVGGTGFPGLRTFLWSYTGHRDWWTYPDIDQLSTTQQVTADYPATLLAVGDADPFEPQAQELATALELAGVPVTTQFFSGAGLGHEYQFDFRIPEARATLDATRAFLAQVTGEGP